jgi:hypothetical protein
MMVVMVMTHHLVVVHSHLPVVHLLAFFRKGRDGEAERNYGRQGNSKLVHRDFLLVVAVASLERYRCSSEPSVNGRYWPGSMLARTSGESHTLESGDNA